MMPKDTRSFIINGLGLLIGFSVLGTVAIGITVTAVLPPLPRVADTSILGRRVVAFVKFGLAAGTLFATAVISWMVAKSYDYYYDGHESSAEPTGQIVGLLGAAISVAALVFWVWLSIDLLRIGRRRRRNGVDIIMRRVRQGARDGRHVHRLARWVMSSKLWIVSAFYLAPAFATLLAVTVPRVVDIALAST